MGSIQKSYGKIAKNNIFKTGLLRNIFITSLVLAIGLPVCNIAFVYPSFTDLLIRSKEDDAIRTATHLASMVTSERNQLNRDFLSEDFLKEVKKTKLDFQLMKLKVFSKAGETIYSTDPKDVGKINKKTYFHDIVANGEPYTKFVQKNTTSLEDQKVTLDVVETYVLIMNGNKFLGAFEIYYDIIGQKVRSSTININWSYSCFYCHLIDARCGT